jgi:hypothetical protein
MKSPRSMAALAATSPTSSSSSSSPSSSNSQRRPTATASPRSLRGVVPPAPVTLQPRNDGDFMRVTGSCPSADVTMKLADFTAPPPPTSAQQRLVR